MDSAAFAAAWEQGWNSHDLDVIMRHYRDDIQFRSQKAIPLTGSGIIYGKPSLRSYWTDALKRQPDLRFNVQDVFEGHEMLIISYLNHRDILASEALYFDSDDLVFQAAACHRPF